MIEKAPVLGTRISLVDLPKAIAEIDRWIVQRDPGFVCVRDVHGIVRALDEPGLAEVHCQAALVVPDGWPLVKLLRWRGYRGVERVRGADLFRELCRFSVARNHSHFLYGGGDGTADALADVLREQFPGIRIVGTHCPPFRPLTEMEEAAEIDLINASGADIVWVGLSTPKQEYWMAARSGRLNAAALIGVGAAFDFLTGRQREAPRLIQRSGFEWLYRALSEPRRLGPRYARTVPRFIWLALKESLSLRRRSPTG